MTPLEYDRARIWHPYASLKNPPPVLHAKAASGLEIETADGQKLIDAVSSWWCVAHGHNHPAIVEAIRRQSEKMCHVMFGGFTHDPAIELAEKLAAIAPRGLDHVFFADSGSISVEVAAKMAVQYQNALGHPERNRLLALKGGYHGDTSLAMALSDPDGMHTLFKGIMTKHFFAEKPSIPTWGEWNDADAESLRRVVDEHGGEIAAIICEPVFQAANAMNFYHPEYLREMRRLCDERGMLLIFDEIAAGFYRTGPLWAHSRAGITPDIMTVGKALTGGHMTLAATLASGKVADTISGGRPSAFMHGPTYMANAACASLDLFAKGDYEANAKRIESVFARRIMPLKALSNVVDVRVLGAAAVVEVHRMPAQSDISRIIRDSGVWLRPFGNFIYSMPPLVADDRTIDRIGFALMGLAASPPVSASSVSKVASRLVERALSHERGTPDFINVKVEALPKGILRLKALPVKTHVVATPAEGRALAARLLADAGISRIDEIMARFSVTHSLRGAMLLDADTLERLEPDKSRGVRATYMDDAASIARGTAGVKNHYAEAIVLATKVQNAPGIVAEICVSDDPDYVTGYVATRELGYRRITVLKEKGDPNGGRIFLYRGPRDNVAETIEFLEKTPVLVEDVPTISSAANAPRRFDGLAAELESRRAAGLWRECRTLEGPTGPTAIVGGRELVVFASNDYLDLARDPRVVKAAADAAKEFGAGSGGSRLTTGTQPVHVRLEDALAKFKGSESALLYGTGYMANVGAISSLVGKGDAVLSDELNHASIIDGCRLSGADVLVYRHGDMEDLDRKLGACREHRRRLAVSDFPWWTRRMRLASSDVRAAAFPSILAATCPTF